MLSINLEMFLDTNDFFKGKKNQLTTSFVICQAMSLSEPSDRVGLVDIYDHCPGHDIEIVKEELNG